jgi:hypothetical protein
VSARRRQPEAQLQRSVLDHLRWRGQPNIFFMHYPSGGYRSPVEAMVLKGLGVQPGDGRLFGLELKTERRELSDIQHNTIEAMRTAGAVCGVAHGLDEAIAWLEQHALLRGRAT